MHAILPPRHSDLFLSVRDALSVALELGTRHRQRLADLAGSLRPDAAYPLEFLFARLRQGFDRAEVAQQVAALGRTDAGDPVQLGGEKTPASEIAVIRNREAMGLVSDALQDMRGG